MFTTSSDSNTAFRTVSNSIAKPQMLIQASPQPANPTTVNKPHTTTDDQVDPGRVLRQALKEDNNEIEAKKLVINQEQQKHIDANRK